MNVLIWEALGSAALGLLLAIAVLRRSSARTDHRRVLVLLTGPVTALVGTAIAWAVLGPGHPLATVAIAAVCAAAMLSLFLGNGVQPGGGTHGTHSTRATTAAN